MTIQAAFDELREEIDKTVIRATRHLAEEGLKAVVNGSPVATGAYVGSHRVSVDGITVAPPRIPSASTFSPMEISRKIFANAGTEKAKAISTERLKLSGIKLFSNITILNQAQHAATVEYIGWGQTAPYGVYMKAESYLKALGALEF